MWAGLFIANVCFAAVCFWQEIMVGGPIWALMAALNFLGAAALWHWRADW